MNRLLVALFTLACAIGTRAETVTATIYADNYFDFYVDGTLVKSDPLNFTPHNAVQFTFEASGTRQYAIRAKDFATTSGYEYTSSSSPQLGDGALRIVMSDGTVSSTNWKCFTTSYGPTAASEALGCSATNLAACALTATAEPTNWTLSSFNDASWSNATKYTEAEAGWGMTPVYSGGKCGTITDPLTRQVAAISSITTTASECLDPRVQSWGQSVFIWQSNLKKDNTILCRYKYVPGSSSTGGSTSGGSNSTSTCTTTSGPKSGSKCVFPFTYKGVTHTSCTKADDTAAWCATSTDSSGNFVTGNYGYCPSTCTSEATCAATCKYSGVTYTGCTSVGSTKPWCCTSTDSSGNYQSGKWRYCTAGSDSVVTTTGTACKASCKYKGTTFYGCTTLGDTKAWCCTATATDGSYVSGKWGYCA